MIENKRIFSDLVALYLVENFSIEKGNMRLILESVTHFCITYKTDIFTVKDIMNNIVPQMKRSTIFNYLPAVRIKLTEKSIFS